MIVVAIIGILAAVAIPQYQDYTLKAKLSKVMVVAAPIKVALGIYNQELGGFPTIPDPWSSIGLLADPTKTNEVSAIAWNGTRNPVAAGTGIALTLTNIKSKGVDGGTVTFTPVVNSTSITWSHTCSGALTDKVVIYYFNC